MDTRLRVHHTSDHAQYGLEYSLFEEIDGPVSDHTLNLYQALLESRDLPGELALVVLDGPYDKADPYYGALAEVRANVPVLRSAWTLDIVPILRIEAETAKLEPIVRAHRLPRDRACGDRVELQCRGASEIVISSQD